MSMTLYLSADKAFISGASLQKIITCGVDSRILVCDMYLFEKTTRFLSCSKMPYWTYCIFPLGMSKTKRVVETLTA